MVVFGQRWLYSGKSGCIRESFCVRAKIVVLGQKWLYSGKVVVFRKKWFYSGKKFGSGEKGVGA